MISAVVYVTILIIILFLLEKQKALLTLQHQGPGRQVKVIPLMHLLQNLIILEIAYGEQSIEIHWL